MYQPNTVLTIKDEFRDQFPDDPETGDPFPYMTVRVIGESPISYTGGEWTGLAAHGVIVEPMTLFSSNLDEPLGKLQELYKIVSIPEITLEPRFSDREAELALLRLRVAPTPEEVFAELAPGPKPEDGQTRARTPIVGESPLPDPRVEAAKSPLSRARKPKDVA